MTADVLNALDPGRLVEHYLADLAWNVIPARDKRPIVPTWRRFQTVKLGERERRDLLRHVERGGQAFLVCGGISNVAVLDIDTTAAVAAWRERLGDDWSSIPKARTPRGGYHLFFATNGREVGTLHRAGPLGWDLKADGGGVVLPSGDGRRVWEVVPTDALPDFAVIADLIASAVEDEVDRDDRVASKPTLSDLLAEPPTEGGRNDWLTQIAGHYARNFDRRGDYEHHVLEAARSTDPPMSEAEAFTTARSIWRAERDKTEREIAEEVKKLKVRHEAKQRFNAELHAASGNRTVFDLADMFELADAPIDWVIPNLIAAGDKGLIAGPPKSLKTWLALHLARSMILGGAALGESTWNAAPGQNVLYVQEEGTVQRWGHRLKTVFDGQEVAGFSTMHRSAMSLLRPYDVSEVIETAQAVDARAIFLDPLQRIMPGVNENDASEQGPAWDAIHRIAGETGAAVFVVHHARKGTGERLTMDAIRGSSRTAGEADLMLIVQRLAEPGTLELFLEGRDLPPRPEGGEGNLTIKFDPDKPCSMNLAGPRIRLKGPTNTTRPAVEAVLQKARRPLAAPDIAVEVERDLTSVNRALNKLLTDGLVNRLRGRGRGGLWEWRR